MTQTRRIGRMLLADRKQNLSNAATHALAVALALIAPLSVFLTANEYSVVAPEVWPIYLLALLFGLLVAVFVLMRKPLLSRAGLWAGVTTAIALMVADISVFTLVVAAIALATLLKLLGEHAAKITLLAALVHVSATIALSQTSSTFSGQNESALARLNESPNSDLPPVLHIVFDEMIGPHGLPAEMLETGKIQSSISALFNAQGFDVLRRAYTQYGSTSDSISNLFNFDSSPVQGRYYSRAELRPVLSENRYFQHLSGLGYSIDVYESSHLDFCNTPAVTVSNCYRYRGNSIAAIRDHDFATTRKSRFILESFLESSRFWRGLRRSYNAGTEAVGVDLPVWAISNSHSGPLTSMPVIEHLTSALREMRSGQVYFAHLMLPHYPYALNADCTIKPNIDAWAHRAPRSVLGTLRQQNDTSSRAARYAQYLQQYQCTLRTIVALFDAIRSSGQWQDSIIIVQGDHGSRIVRHFPDAGGNREHVEDDFRDLYSTFFAIKNANSTGASDANRSITAICTQTKLGSRSTDKRTARCVFG